MDTGITGECALVMQEDVVSGPVIGVSAYIEMSLLRAGKDSTSRGETRLIVGSLAFC